MTPVSNWQLSLKKNKSMQKRINLDVCGVCRKRNCTKGGRKCDGIQRCAKCAYPGHTAAQCTELEYCTHCVNTGHTSGSLKCKENQKYSREKRIAFNRQNATNQVPQDRPNEPNRPQPQQSPSTPAEQDTDITEPVQITPPNPGTTENQHNAAKPMELSNSHIRTIYLTAAFNCKLNNYDHDAFQATFDQMFTDNGHPPIKFSFLILLS